MDLVATKVS